MISKQEIKTTKSVTTYSQNVIAVKEGKDTSKQIIVGAHYDSVLAGFGIDDNASGVAALLETAKYYSKNKAECNIVFVAFGAEETGCNGSAAYVKKMTEEEKGIVKEQIETFKSYADLIAQGEYYRLSNATEENVFYVAWEFVKEDKTEALLSYVQIHPQTNLLYVRIRWKGLDPRKNYKVEKEVYSGEVLMNIGYLLPVLQGDYRSFQIHIQEQA